MKHLIIYCHPNKNSFCHDILDRFVVELKNVDADVKVRDLYALDFNPILTKNDLKLMEGGMVAPDVAEEQNLIHWADIVTFIYPIWWTGMPALLKGYIDRTFCYDFAFCPNGDGLIGMLSSKKVNIINTMRASEDLYRGNGMIFSMQKTIDEGVFEFCGMKVMKHLYFCTVPTSQTFDREAMLSQIGELVGQSHSMWY
ncbi:MAG: NAD(P)H-dependent oxidoreductase [Bacteroidales bacterium]